MRAVISCIVLSISAGGCGAWFGSAGDEPARARPLSSAYSNTSSGTPSAVDARRAPADDRPGALNVDRPRVDPLGSDVTRNTTINPPPEGARETIRESLSKTLPGPTTSPNASTNGAPKAQPAAGRPRGAQGDYITVGGMVVEVNGTPIFANKVLEPLTPMLSAKAKTIDERAFRRLAITEIKNQTDALIRDELEFATAQRNLDANEKKIADMLTQRWRDDQIRRAGGSLQLTRQQAAAQGVDFDEVVKQRYRYELLQVYLAKKEWPKIQTTAEDMRRYYDSHLKDQFTQREAAQFRLIKIGIKKTGGREPAYDKARGLQIRAQRGEDFAMLASQFNDDDFLLKSQGAPSGMAAGQNAFIDRGAYANPKVEEAVWNLQPGQVSDLIETPDTFYIAKLEQKKPGRVMNFEEDTVQDAIRGALRKEQFDALRTSARERLMRDAIIFPNPPMYEAALEMAMQKYPQWAGAK